MAKGVKQVPGTAPPGMDAHHRDSESSYLWLILFFTVIVFWPLLRYFFAQDDFELILKSAYAGGDFVRSFFHPSSGQFRPLTKGVYFAVMYKVFHLHPLPFHLVSLAVHLLNIVLFCRLTKRFISSTGTAMVVSSLFAFHLAFVNVVGWISCIQQLLGEFFFLACLVVGIDALDEGRKGRLALSLLLYVLALLSLEQTYPAPLVLALYLYFKNEEKATRSRIIGSLTGVLPMLALMSGYLLFMLAWKKLPEGGPYQVHLGGNIVTNTLTYSHWVYNFFMRIPLITDKLSTGLTVSHLFIVSLIAYNVFTGRRAIAVFGPVFYGLTILPVTFLVRHTYPNHLYLPSFGMLLLLAPAIEDMEALVAGASEKAREYFLPVALGLIFVFSLTQLRAEEKDFVREDYPLPSNFVLRRAILAGNAVEDIKERLKPLPRDGNFFAVYLRKASWYGNNVVAALGSGAAVKLVYENPTLNVYFHQKGDTLSAYDPENSHILFFDEMGHFYNQDELEEMGGSVVPVDQ